VNIEDNVPFPEGISKIGRPRKYPFDELQPGQSFFVSGKKRKDLAGSAALAQCRTGFKFVIIDSLDGVRVWRSTAE
jgi:hypothetical protein